MGQTRVEPVNELMSGIEKTRADMSGTLGEIEERLSPGHLREQVMEQLEIARHEVSASVKDELREIKQGMKGEIQELKQGVKSELREIKQGVKNEIQDAKSAVRAATIGKVETMVQSAGDSMSEAKTTVVDVVRQNPIPAALVGVGLLWMFFNGGSRDRASASSSMNPRIGVRAQRVARDTASKVKDTAVAAEHAVEAFAHDARDKVGELAHDAGDTVGSMAHVARDKVGELATRTQDTARAIGTQATEGAQRLQVGFQDTLHDNPLAIGAAAFALGTAVGLAIPSTRREDQALGAVRDQLFAKAEKVAHEAVSKAEEKVTEAIDGVQKGANATPKQPTQPAQPTAPARSF